MDLEKISHKELADLAVLLEQQETAYQERSLDLYRPHPGQERFHKSPAKIRVVVTGNRWGKTTASVIEAIRLCTGTHPYHPRQLPVKGKLYGESFPMIDEYMRPKFEQWLPRKSLHARKPFKHNQQGHLSGINFADGSRIVLSAYAQQEESSEGSDWDFVGFDEPPTRELYVANLRGLVDRNGLMWFTCTPLSEPWIFDDLWEPGINRTKPFVECFGGSIYDNPNIDPEGRDLFIEEMTEEEKEIRVYGKFTKLRGLVIDTYDPYISDIDPFPLTSNFSIYEGIDPGGGGAKPHSALWKAIDKDGYRFVVANLSCPDGIAEFGKQIAAVRRTLTARGAQLVRSISDTSLNQADPNFRQNMRDNLCASLRSRGETLMPSNAQKRDWLLPGIEKLRDLYRPVEQIIQGRKIKAPMQYVFRDCQLYKQNLKHYQWPQKGILADNTNPVKKDEDFIDCDRYIESTAPAYQTPGTTGIVRNFNGAYSPIQTILQRSHLTRRNSDLSSPSPSRAVQIPSNPTPAMVNYLKNSKLSFRGIPK